jgi:hypothetical protein
MKIAAAVSILLLSAASVAAQNAPAPGPQPVPRDPPSNLATGVNVDQYISYADRVIPTVTHDVMIKRTLLSAGDPNGGGKHGAVLRYHKEVALWDLAARNATPLTTLPELIVLYVESGAGTLDDGKLVWDLKPGMAALIPSNLAHRFTNTGDAPLKMMTASQAGDAPGVKQRADILVRDVDKLVLTERNVHWVNMSKYVFLGEDGLYPTDHMYIVYMPPWTMAGAHAHTPGQQEFWIKVTDAPAIMQMGSEIRPWPINAGFMVPPNGRTVHAAINNSDETQAWFYMSRLADQPPPPPATPRPGAAAIAEAVVKATIPGRPLAPPARR